MVYDTSNAQSNTKSIIVHRPMLVSSIFFRRFGGISLIYRDNVALGLCFYLSGSYNIGPQIIGINRCKAPVTAVTSYKVNPLFTGNDCRRQVRALTEL